MSTEPILLTIDVGGTKTKLEAVSTAGQVLAEKIIPTALTSLKKDIRIFIKKIGKKPEALMAGFRGTWNEAEKLSRKKMLKGLAPTIYVMSDIELLHFQYFGPTAGICLNAGTGSICLGRSNTGRWIRAGGLGPLVGDEGSAFWIGKTYLSEVLSEKWPLEKLRAYVKNDTPVRKIASLAKIVITKAGRNGKGKEARIVGKAQDYLVELVASVSKQLRSAKALPLVLVGGLFTNTGFRSGFTKKLQKRRIRVILQKD